MSDLETSAQYMRAVLATFETSTGDDRPAPRPRWARARAWGRSALRAAALVLAASRPVAVGAAVIGLPVVLPSATNGITVYPGPTDLSAGSPAPTGAAANALLAGLPPTNLGSLAIPGATPTFGSEETTPTVEGTPQAQLVDEKIPAGAKPSPLFGAAPWTQPLPLFEEFGTDTLDAGALVNTTATLPRPVSPHGGPADDTLDDYLALPGLFPFPTRLSNTAEQNPWRDDVSAFLGRTLASAPAEGRPPGEGWAHQRWDEFKPRVYVKTAQAAGRINTGLRDPRQLHRYAVGEWAAGGLYHRGGSSAGTELRFHPNFPVQAGNSVWTFDGTLPPKLLMVRYGQPVLLRHYNALPIDPSANRGFGLHTLTTHEHNGHNPAESDGFANAFFFPGQFYDYRWPMQLAGYDSVNAGASDRRAGFPCAAGETLEVKGIVKTCTGGRIDIPGDWRETMSTHWFHDHMLDFTAQNVYKGNVAMMNYYSALDRGNERINDGVNLRLPSGSALAWGNRDYDINLMIADKAWGQDGQLWFNPFQKDGFVADRLLVNWAWKPTLDVRARRYRLRILDGSVARYLALGLVKQVQGSAGEYPGPAGSNLSYDRVPFYLIANDGNVMEHAVAFDGKVDLDRNGNADEHKGLLPTQAIGERYDIVVDFGAANNIRPGDKLYLVNTLEHKTGKEVNRKVTLADIVSERYKVINEDKDGDRIGDRYKDGDPAVGALLQFAVKPWIDAAGRPRADPSMNPKDYVAGKKKMIVLPINRSKPADQALIKAARHRTFEFGHSNGTDETPWTVKTDGGSGYSADMRRISAAPRLAYDPTYKNAQGDIIVNAVNDPAAAGKSAELEVWRLVLNGGWSHPVHIHFEEGVILRRGGKPPPDWEKWARKDLFRIGPEADSGDSVEVALRFREFAGTFMEHCHNTTHEDNGMLMRWDVERPGQVVAMPMPLPAWEGVQYVGSAALPTYRSGDAVGPSFKF